MNRRDVLSSILLDIMQRNEVRLAQCVQSADATANAAATAAPPAQPQPERAGAPASDTRCNLALSPEDAPIAARARALQRTLCPKPCPESPQGEPRLPQNPCVSTCACHRRVILMSPGEIGVCRPKILS